MPHNWRQEIAVQHQQKLLLTEYFMIQNWLLAKTFLWGAKAQKDLCCLFSTGHCACPGFADFRDLMRTEYRLSIHSNS
jgi:hypothetical protein